MSNTTYLISKDTLNTIAKGAMGAITFGAYNQFTINKTIENQNKVMEMNNEKQNEIMKINNEKMDLYNKIIEINNEKTDINEIKNNYKKEMNEIKNNHKTEMNEMKNNYKREIDKLNEKINNLEKRRFWF